MPVGESRLRFEAGGIAVEGSGRFLGLEMRLAALKICFASFSSEKILVRLPTSDFEMFSGLLPSNMSAGADRAWQQVFSEMEHQC